MLMRYRCPMCDRWHYPLADSRDLVALGLMLRMGFDIQPFTTAQWVAIIRALRLHHCGD